jgi:NAD-dependent protein deacetylase/lipoamidase
VLDPFSSCARLLADARSVVISTGAGMSRESGIPTFRDAPNALWAQFDPEKLATRDGFRRDPALVWRWYAERREMIAAAKPNAGHFAIAELESVVDEVTVITQNIDNLHRAAGSRNVIEIHGNIFRFKCLDRSHPIEQLAKTDEVPPRCPCGSFARPDVVWFGEMLPEREVERAYAALAMCDVAVVVGTSGTVYPAAGFPVTAKEAGARIIEVNPEETPLTPDADFFFRGPAGDVLPKLVLSLKAQISRGTVT